MLSFVVFGLFCFFFISDLSSSWLVFTMYIYCWYAYLPRHWILKMSKPWISTCVNFSLNLIKIKFSILLRHLCPSSSIKTSTNVHLVVWYMSKTTSDLQRATKGSTIWCWCSCRIQKRKCYVMASGCSRQRRHISVQNHSSLIEWVIFCLASVLFTPFGWEVIP